MLNRDNLTNNSTNINLREPKKERSRQPCDISYPEFVSAVLLRDGGKCVYCKSDTQNVIKIFDSRLWSGEGNFLDNGATLCEECVNHPYTESISVNELKRRANIKSQIIPEILGEGYEYDRWGNVLMPNGTWAKGPLFNEPDVIRNLESAGTLHLFTDKIKYPRTYHLPWSPGVTDDDKVLSDTSHFEGREVVVTMKMDGENTTIMRDCLFARSTDSANHPSRNWVKTWAAGFQYELPPGWKIRGENLYAKHSIFYNDLPSYFLGFAIWDERNICLGWEETIKLFDVLGISTPAILYKGTWDGNKIRKICEDLDTENNEGIVVRTTDSFFFTLFSRRVAKYVRADHVQTTEHWKNLPIIPNRLAS